MSRDIKSQNKVSKVSRSFFSISFLNYIIFIGDSLISLYASQTLDLKQIGRYNVLTYLIPTFSIIILFGLDNISGKYIPKYDEQKEYNKSAGFVFMSTLFSMTISLIFFLIYLIFSKPISTFLIGTPDYQHYIILESFFFLFIPVGLFNLFLLARYKYKRYFFSNIIGYSIKIITFIYFINKNRDISAFFYATIFGEGIKFFLTLINLILTYKKPNFSIEFKNKVKFAFPLFINNLINLLFSFSIPNAIFYYFFKDLGQMGILYYFFIITNASNIIINSISNVLTIYYASIIASSKSKEELRERFYKITFGISRIFSIISFIIGLSFIIFSSLFIKIIFYLFHYSSDYSIATIMMIIYGFYFIFSSYYYIVPAMLNIFKNSTIILGLQLLRSLSSILFYFVFIKTLGLPGITLSRTLAFIIYLYFCKIRIEKENIKIGFDRRILAKLVIASIPFAILLPITYLYNLKDTSFFMLNIFGLLFKIPLNAIIITTLALVIGLVLFLLILRILEGFKEDEKKLLEEMLGKKIGKIIIFFIVKKSKKK
ncbi:MAG: lipopolysaccharide biosynthesis protein [Promethearchaeota archaeon]